MNDLDKAKQACKLSCAVVFFLAAVEIGLAVWTIVLSMGSETETDPWSGVLLLIVAGLCFLRDGLYGLQALKGSNMFVMRLILLVTGAVCAGLGRSAILGDGWWVNLASLLPPCIMEYYISVYRKLSENSPNE